VLSSAAERKSHLEYSLWSLTFSASHVAKTGDIKDFIITEESGIAKGIRRIIAVTGHEAVEANRCAQEMSAKLDRIEIMTGKEKDAALKTFPIVSLKHKDLAPDYHSGYRSRTSVKWTCLWSLRVSYVTDMPPFGKHLTS
jgi:hypothetical protein